MHVFHKSESHVKNVNLLFMEELVIEQLTPHAVENLL